VGIALPEPLHAMRLNDAMPTLSNRQTAWTLRRKCIV